MTEKHGVSENTIDNKMIDEIITAEDTEELEEGITGSEHSSSSSSDDAEVAEALEMIKNRGKKTKEKERQKGVVERCANE